MEALKCPVCEGKQTVPDGFYGMFHEGQDRIDCRSCDGKGYVLAPGLAPTHYVPMPYYPYWPPPFPTWPWHVYTTDTPLITWCGETSGTNYLLPREAVSQ